MLELEYIILSLNRILGLIKSYVCYQCHQNLVEYNKK